MKIFIYHWVFQDATGGENEDQKELVIRVYGINEKNEMVCLHVRNFYPWMCVEIYSPFIKNWTDYKKMLKTKITDMCKNIEKPFHIVFKKKLYLSAQNDVRQPFLKLRFASLYARKQCLYKLQNKKTTLMGKKIEFLCHEHEASPFLQLLCQQDLNACGWTEFEGQFVTERRRCTGLTHEYFVDASKLKKIEDKTDIPNFVCISFDLEVYSSDPKRMPNAEIDKDVIFQISYVITRADKKAEKHLHTLGKVSRKDLSVDVVREFASEKDLLMGFHELIREKNPHVMIGYNIFGFDIPYLSRRAQLLGIWKEWSVLGVSKFSSPLKDVSWSSSAYSYQEFHYLETEGRIWIDLLPIVRRDYKFSNYRLKTVSAFFLGETKDPMTPKDIFEAYEKGVLDGKDKKHLTRCGKYCVQDSALVLKLFQKLEVMIGLIEMAKICNVPILSLFVQGQQIKTFSQVFRKCQNDGILVQSFKSLSPDIVECLTTQNKYSGAFVFPPKPGLYEWVVPYDFSSLYPTTIMAYNIDYSTLVTDESVPDEKCHIIEWDDHIGCEHDTEKTTARAKFPLCQHHRYRFLREPAGVIPTLLKTLLQQRSITKKQLKDTEDSTLSVVLDKRQLAYKVSANSMYGGMGVQKGYLPFMIGAMATTAMGRMSIQKAAEYVKTKHKGHLIYGDSVSPETPVYIKCGNDIDIMMIRELFDKLDNKKPFPRFRPWDQTIVNKEQSIPSNTYFIQSRSGWTELRRVIRHSTKKKMYRVMTTSGFADTTEDHSLLTTDNKMISPKLLMKDSCFEQQTELPLLATVNASYIEKFSKLNCPYYYKEGMWSRKNNSVYINKSNHFTFCGLIYMLFKRDYPNAVFNDNPEGADWIIDLENIQNIPQGKILSIQEINTTNEVYDIETEDGSFHCGIGGLVVKNTDSIYSHFEKYNDSKSLWKMAKNMEKEFCQLFPEPMKLVFEEKIYRRFLILTKKRYMALTCKDDGKIEDKLTIRGVLLARRDNCKWIRDVYEVLVRSIMTHASYSYCIDYLCNVFKDMFQLSPELSNPHLFVVSKLVGKEYKIRPLPEDSMKKVEKRCMEMRIPQPPPSTTCHEITTRWNPYITGNHQSSSCPLWIREYIEKSKPAHVQLACKMSRRGQPVNPGSRIEYLVMEHPLEKAKLNEKIEDPIYYIKHRDILRMDRVYYATSLCKPVDQILEIVFHKKDVCTLLLSYHLSYQKVVAQYKEKYIYPRFIFSEKKTTTAENLDLYDFIESLNNTPKKKSTKKTK